MQQNFAWSEKASLSGSSPQTLLFNTFIKDVLVSFEILKSTGLENGICEYATKFSVFTEKHFIHHFNSV